MTKQASQPRARSLYRQVRLTCTQEASGRVTYSIWSKGTHQQWNEGQVLVRDSVVFGPHLETTEDVMRMLMVVLQEQLLPVDD